MDPSNTPKDPLTGGSAPVSPEIPQPLNTAGPVMAGTTSTSSPVSDSNALPLGGSLPVQLPGNPEVTQSSGGSKKMMIIIIIILVLAILGVGGYYFYMQYASKGSKSTSSSPDIKTAPDLSGLKKEADGIQVTDPTGDLVDVDKEINLLEATPSASSSAKMSR